MQEELENLGHIPGVDPCFLTPDAFTSLPCSISDKSETAPPTLATTKPAKAKTKTESSTKESSRGLPTGSAEIDGEKNKELLVQDVEGGEEIEETVVPLKPPLDMFSTPQQHPLHIFVSTWMCTCTWQ